MLLPSKQFLLKVNIRFTRKSCEIFSQLTLKTRVQIKRIAIAMAKCNLFFQYRDAKEILFNYFRDTKLCAKHKKSPVNSVYWDHLCKVNKWCLVDCFHREFMVSIQIMFITIIASRNAKFFSRSKLFTLIRTLKKPNDTQPRSDVLIVNFEHISLFFIVLSC